MNIITRWGRALLIAAAVMVVGVSAGWAQTAQADTALVPFTVNVDATVKAVRDGTGGNARTVTMQVSAGEESILRLPLGAYVGVAYAAPGRANAPSLAVASGGKITLNLPTHSYKSAEVSLYTVNGRRILRGKAAASEAAKRLSARGVAPGVYLMSVKGDGGNKFSSRVTHSGGELNIAVVFRGGNVSSPDRMSKKTAGESWTVIVSANGYTNSGFSFAPTVGMNPPRDITLSAAEYDVPVISAVATSTNSITVSWQRISDATAYRVYSGASLDGTYSLVGSVSYPSYTHTGLETGKTYYYQVSAFNGSSGEGERSSPDFAKTGIFNAPSNVIVATVSGGGFKLFWDAITGADGYNVYVSTVSYGDYTLLDAIPSSSGTSYILNGLELNANYYYKVSAYNSNGEGALSNASKVDYKWLVDTRDDNLYKTTTYWGKRWMAENLNYRTASGSWCYENKADSCAKYGRLYDWATAMNIDPFFNENVWGGGDVKQKGICPSGWHLPLRAEWDALVMYVENEYKAHKAGWYLKNDDGYWYWDGKYGSAGSDPIGFSGLPGGRRNADGSFNGAGGEGIWWAATELDMLVYNMRMVYDSDRAETNVSDKYFGFSVRCVAD